MQYVSNCCHLVNSWCYYCAHLAAVWCELPLHVVRTQLYWSRKYCDIIASLFKQRPSVTPTKKRHSCAAAPGCSPATWLTKVIKCSRSQALSNTYNPQYCCVVEPHQNSKIEPLLSPSIHFYLGIVSTPKQQSLCCISKHCLLLSWAWQGPMAHNIE